MNERVPDPTDLHIGAKLREARVAKRTFQAVVGQVIGVSYVQIAKYESGTDRISASNLHKLARFFGRSIKWFCPPKTSEK